jgi:hypothetical protein
MNPAATLTITMRPTGVLLYEARNATGAVVWASLCYDSESGRERVRERLRAWLAMHSYKVVLDKQRRAG